eukprot:5631883-Amphidinium_carterae.1
MPAMAVLTMVCAIVEVVMGVAGPEDPARSDVGDESDPARSESTGGAATGVPGAAHSATEVAGAAHSAELEAACGGAGVAGGAAAEMDGFIHFRSVCKTLPSGKTAF